MSVEHNIGNCVTSCMQTSASMRTFSCEHIRVRQKGCVEGRLFTVNMHRCPSRGKTTVLRQDFVCEKNCILRRVRKLSHAVVHRFDLSMENLVTKMVSYV